MSSLPPLSQLKLKQFFQLGLRLGCTPDQLRNFVRAGIILQEKQLAASAAARLCDRPNGPTAVGFGGARGGGKTHWLLAQIAADDCQRVPGLKCLLVRKVGKSNLENFEDLRLRLFSRLPHDFNASRGILTFKNGSRIFLGHYRCEKDIDAYLGLEYDAIGVEEATQLTQRKHDAISTCCRTSRPDWRPRIYATTNPGDIGHKWFFDKFIVPHRAGTESATRFIPARVEDNRFVHREYKDSLDRLTGWQYPAWRHGDWGLLAGQFFRNFRPDVHLLPDTFKENIAVEWIAAMDYGYTHPTVVLLACLDHQDNLYVLDEYVERYGIVPQLARQIKAMLARHLIYGTLDHLREALLAEFPVASTQREALWHARQRRLLDRFVAGADVFNRESNGESIANQYRQLGLRLWPANMDRVSGWSAVLQRLGDPDKGIPPTLFFHPRCKFLLERLPYLQHDPDRPGDVLKTNINEEGIGGDDAGDTLRYLVATRSAAIIQRKLAGL